MIDRNFTMQKYGFNLVFGQTFNLSECSNRVAAYN